MALTGVGWGEGAATAGEGEAGGDGDDNGEGDGDSAGLGTTPSLLGAGDAFNGVDRGWTVCAWAAPGEGDGNGFAATSTIPLPQVPRYMAATARAVTPSSFRARLKCTSSGTRNKIAPLTSTRPKPMP